MAENHRTFRLPLWLWQRYAEGVGDAGRSADLKLAMDFLIDHPDFTFGPDVDGPHDFPAKIRVEPERWQLFQELTADDGDASSRIRRYIWWRVQHPGDPLPGRRVPPLQRWRSTPACV